jgi:hypothetical protein
MCGALKNNRLTIKNDCSIAKNIRSVAKNDRSVTKNTCLTVKDDRSVAKIPVVRVINPGSNELPGSAIPGRYNIFRIKGNNLPYQGII